MSHERTLIRDEAFSHETQAETKDWDKDSERLVGGEFSRSV